MACVSVETLLQGPGMVWRQTVGEMRWCVVEADEDLGSSPRSAALTKCLLFTEPQWLRL